MTTILVKNVSSRLDKELRKLKVELGCRTWAELLAKLVEYEGGRELGEGRLREMKAGVSTKWVGRPSVLEDVGKSRRHGAS